MGIGELYYENLIRVSKQANYGLLCTCKVTCLIIEVKKLLREKLNANYRLLLKILLSVRGFKSLITNWAKGASPPVEKTVI